MAPVTHPEPLGSLQQLARDVARSPLSSELSQRSSLEEVSMRSDDLLNAPALLSARDPSIVGTVLTARQASQPIIVPATYVGHDPGANGGEVAGIVLGVVFGICLILWIAASLTTNPFRPVVGTSSVVDVSRNKTESRRERRDSRTARTRSSARKTTRSRSRSAVSAREEMTEITGATSRRERGGGGGGGGGGRSPRRARETIIVEESRRERSRPPPPEDDLAYGDDIVEVIEEESDISPARRPRRDGGYRNVDPDEYGGGSRPMRKVRR